MEVNGPTANATPSVEERTWGEYRVWAKTARALKNRVTRIRRWILSLILACAILGALAVQASAVPDYKEIVGPVVGVIAGLLLTIAGILARQLDLRKKNEDQVRARSAGEALKSAVFLYVTGAPPYDQKNASETLHENTETVLSNVDDVRNEEVTREDRKARLPASPMSVDGYVQKRVQEQIDWYRESQAKNRRAAQRGQLAALCFAIVGAVLAALASLSSKISFLSLISGWIPVVAAISAAVAAYFYSERYEYLETTYRTTARRLSRLVSRRASNLTIPPDSSAELAFVVECENAISVENQSWMAELMKDDKVGP